MKIIADDKIPYLRGVLEPFAEVEYLPGRQIGNHEIKDANALLIRTRTLCNRELLEGSRVKFIGTATIGFDHIDTAYCEEQGIVWKNAPGCNANSVNQYLASALTHLSARYGFSLNRRVLGVVGVGHVGKRVVNTAEWAGMQVYLCDPPRVRNEGVCGFISMEGILRECDIITFHVPLNKDGIDPTWHMVNEELLNRMNPGSFIINTSRGEVVDGQALKKALKSGKLAGAVLDVWENEPLIDRELLGLCSIATPHIAGYSADGKAKGTTMVVQELSRFFSLGLDDWEPNYIPAPDPFEITINCDGRSEESIMAEAIQATYRIEADDQRFRSVPEDFEKQRGNYPLRREFGAYRLILEGSEHDVRVHCRKLGFKVQ